MSFVTNVPSPWVPMKNVTDVQHLGKFVEEHTEAATAAARCLIQGIYESEPITGKINRRWLEEEIADTWATSALVIEHFGLDRDFINKRAVTKTKYLRQWFANTSEEKPRD